MRRPRGFYHFAFPCADAEETRLFYEELLGLPLVHSMRLEGPPSGAEPVPYLHFFFELGDGSYLAFFDLAGLAKPEPSPNTPDWVQHVALEVGSVAEVEAYGERLAAADVPFKGVVDHEFVKSIYFFDPNGLRVEITARTEKPGFLEACKKEAHALLDAWSREKAAHGL